MFKGLKDRHILVLYYNVADHMITQHQTARQSQSEASSTKQTNNPWALRTKTIIAFPYSTTQQEGLNVSHIQLECSSSASFLK